MNVSKSLLVNVKGDLHFYIIEDSNDFLWNPARFDGEKQEM